MAKIRLDKFLANAGCGTRTEVKQFLKKGLVTVDGETVLRPEQKIEEGTARVFCGGREVCLKRFVYYMMNKPAGYLSATRDRRQPTVLDLVSGGRKEELFPAGRLDIDTEGLLLLTNDGALAHELLAPGRHVDKTYLARLDAPVTEEDCRRFLEGLEIGEKKKTMPARLRNCAEKQEFWAKVTVQEGRFHQVKRMFAAVGRDVLYLKRISIGSLRLDKSLPPGAYRELTAEETEGLRMDVKREKSGHI